MRVLDSEVVFECPRFYAFTAHFVIYDPAHKDADGTPILQLHNVVLECKFLDEAVHSADVIAQHYAEAIARWRLEEKVCACVTDRGSNIRSLGERLSIARPRLNDGTHTCAAYVSACGYAWAMSQVPTFALTTLKFCHLSDDPSTNDEVTVKLDHLHCAAHRLINVMDYALEVVADEISKFNALASHINKSRVVRHGSVDCVLLRSAFNRLH